MEVKKGYKNTEVGVIPVDWKLSPLIGLCKQKGLVRGPFGGALKKVDFAKRGFKVYEQKNAIYKSIEMGTYFIDDKKYSGLKRFDLQPNDFIVSCSGTIGKIYLIPRNAPRGIINQALLKITTDDKVVSKKYFLHYFEWDRFQENIIDSTQGGAMKNLVGMSIFRETKFPLPPTLAEQEAIAGALSDVDALIQSLEKLITKKRLIKQGAMQELLKPKEGWVTKELGKTAILKARIGWQGLTTAEYRSSGNYYLITGTDFKNGFIDWEHCSHVEHYRYKQDRNIQVQRSDVLVTKDGTIGKVALITRIPKPATLNSGVFVIRPIERSFHPEFFYYILLSCYFESFLTQLSAGSTINHLYQKDFVHFEFRTPPTIDEQIRIANILSDMDAELSTLETKLAKHKNIKQGMMQELLTGKIRLVKGVN